jgi:Holliday junction resolvase RusA-like endonuclease
VETDLFSVIAGAGAEPAPVCIIEHPGDVRGKGRPRFRYVKPKDVSRPGFVSVYTDAETAAYENALKWRGKAAMRSAAPFEGPLAVRIFAMIRVPASWSNKKRDAALAGLIFPTTKPDGDNIVKAVLDGLNGVIWADDVQVVRHVLIKEYGDGPGLIVEVYKLP